MHQQDRGASIMKNKYITENLEIAAFLSEKRKNFEETAPKLCKVIDNALHSLCAHPTPVTNLHEAKQVKNIGTWILKMLKDFFVEKDVSDPTAQSSSQEPVGRNGKAKRKYCPKKNSAAYALLITLLRAHQSGKEFMLKKDLIAETDTSGLSERPIRPNVIHWNGGQPSSKDLYSGWSAMSTLTEKCLVVKTSNPGKYKLTDEGKLLAQECIRRGGLNQDTTYEYGLRGEEDIRASPFGRESGESSSVRQEGISSDTEVQEIRKSDLRSSNNIHFSNQQVRVEVNNPNFASSQQIASGNAGLHRPVVMERAANVNRHYSVTPTHIQGNSTIELSSAVPEDELPVPPLEAGEKFSDVYEITCILDRREKFRMQGGAVPTLLPNVADMLGTQCKVNVETRMVPVGDALWIARHKQLDEEYVLDFVVERKQVGDLWQSIRDNRYKQQKLRLMNCGLKHLLYLVEGDINTVESTDALKTAMLTTELQGGFHVLRTTDWQDTCRQYGSLTLSIIRRYNMEIGKGRGSGPVCKTYKDFLRHCKDLEKDRVTDVFCLQLTQISQVTEDVARSIQDRYPTLFSVTQAYRKLEGKRGEQEKLLQGIPIQNTTKTISATMSKNVYKAIWAPQNE